MTNVNIANKIVIAKIRPFPALSFLIPVITFGIFNFIFVIRLIIVGNLDFTPISLFYELGVLLLTPPLVWKLVHTIHDRTLNPLSLYIEGRYLIFVNTVVFRESLDETKLEISAPGRLFSRLNISSNSGKIQSIPLFNFDKSGDEIIKAINSHR